MMRKKLILADEDEEYLRELRYEFMEKVPQIDLITFTKKEKIYEYFDQGGMADILAVSEAFAEERLKKMSSHMTRILLSSSMAPIDGFEIIKKYQRMETLADAVLLKYAQDSGTLETICGNSNTRIAAFYSPAGGTGKTSLALAAAAAGANAGLCTLYLNLEEIDSVQDTLERTKGCLSDVFLALKTKGMKPGIKLKESIGMEPTAGFYYVSGVISISEYEEIDENDIKRLLEAVRELSNYDLAVLDLSSGFNEKTRRILETSDVIFVPVTRREGSTAKLQRFLRESGLHGEYELLFNKMNLVLNEVGVGGFTEEQLPEDVRNRLVCCASIAESAVLAKQSNILRAGGSLRPVMDPILQMTMGKEYEGRR